MVTLSNALISVHHAGRVYTGKNVRDRQSRRLYEHSMNVVARTNLAHGGQRSGTIDHDFHSKHQQNVTPCEQRPHEHLCGDGRFLRLCGTPPCIS